MSVTSANASPVWFVTGCSTGFGRELALAVLARGWRCVATARNKASLDDLAPEASERLLRVSLDVNDRAQIDAAVALAQAQFGGIDVLVNNAGYGYQSSIEEGDEPEGGACRYRGVARNEPRGGFSGWDVMSRAAHAA